jgi:hypothetical protein
LPPAKANMRKMSNQSQHVARASCRRPWFDVSGGSGLERGLSQPVGPKLGLNKRTFHVLRAGGSDVARAAKRRGAITTVWETDHDRINYTLPWVSDLILGESGRGILGGVWFGLDNTSWSASRLQKKGSVPPQVHGGPLRPDEITLGNKQARWAARLFEKLAKTGTPVAIENPSSSLVWLTPLYRGLLARFGFRDVDMCAFGAPCRNRTRILFANWKLHGLANFRCHGKGNICSYTGGKMTKPTELFRYVVSRL